MDTFSALLFFVGNSPVTGEFPTQRPVTRSFEVFFDLRLNKCLSKQSRRRWFETPSRSLCEILLCEYEYRDYHLSYSISQITSSTGMFWARLGKWTTIIRDTLVSLCKQPFPLYAEFIIGNTHTHTYIYIIYIHAFSKYHIWFLYGIYVFALYTAGTFITLCSGKHVYYYRYLDGQKNRSFQSSIVVRKHDICIV